MKTEETIPIQVVAYRDICRHPECDTRRLAYADLLDELGDEQVPCPKCGRLSRVRCTLCDGDGDSGDYHASRRCYRCDGQGSYRPDCKTCESSGTVLSTANRDRAEFVRVQVALAPFRPVIDAHAPEAVYTPQLRERELLAAHLVEWRKCPCPACDGEGLTYHPWSDTTGRILTVGGPSQSFVCHVCGGTGDLFASRWIGVKERTRLEYRTVTFSRGFPDSVECTAADVWREWSGPCRHCNGERCPVCDGQGTQLRTVPTEWAKAVVRETPVTKFDIGAWTGLLPFAVPSQNYKDVPSLIGEWVRSKAF